MKRTIWALAAAALLSVAAMTSGGTTAEAAPLLGNMSRIDTGAGSAAEPVHCRRWRHCHWVQRCWRWRCWRNYVCHRC